MKSTLMFSGLLTCFVQVGFSTPNLTRAEYVKTYEQIAVHQMLTHRIPASITLAQGILESGSGNSELAKKANNHFGIKCHNDWKGERMYMDDDAKNECFRSYAHVEESYADHSLFLTQKTRYAFLFELPIDDYKSWAKGLKQAGYATNPKYADLLIQLIEDLNLNRFDENSSSQVTTHISALNKMGKQTHANKVDFVVARKGDTFYRIAKQHGLTLLQLHAYNDFHKEKDCLQEGDIVYLEPKRNFGKEKGFVVLDKPCSLREVSQIEAVKLKKLMRKNQISSPDEQLSIGEKIFLR
jgi:LysM repeat protein